MNNQFEPISEYWRRPQFDYFSKLQFPFYAFTLRMDISGVKAFCKRHGYSLQINLCYRFNQAAMGVADMMVRLREERLVRYQHLHVASTVAKPNGGFGFATFPYDEDMHKFNAAANRIRERVAQSEAPSFAAEPHENMVFFSALTGLPFTGLTHAPTNNRLAGEPMVTFGRYEREGDRTVIPVGIQVNHVFVDGTGLNQLYERLERLYRKENP